MPRMAVTATLTVGLDTSRPLADTSAGLHADGPGTGSVGSRIRQRSDRERLAIREYRLPGQPRTRLPLLAQPALDVVGRAREPRRQVFRTGRGDQHVVFDP